MAHLAPFLSKISGLQIHGKGPKSLFFRGWVGEFTSFGQLSIVFYGQPIPQYGVIPSKLGHRKHQKNSLWGWGGLL